MKNLTLIIILLVSFFQCTSQKQSEYFDTRYKIVKAKILKIEEKNSIYVYHFKSGKMIGIFAKEKSCLRDTKSWKNIILNQNYNLILHQPINANLRSAGIIETLNGEFVWDSDMREIYYDDCKNICGNKIYELRL